MYTYVIHCWNGCTDMFYYCVIFVILNLKKEKRKKKRFSLQSSFPREIASLCQAKIPASNLLFGDDTDRLVKSAREQFGAPQHRGGAHSSHRYRRGGSGLRSHSEHRFPAPSSKLWHICLRHWRGTLYLRAAVHRRGQCPPKGLGTNNYDCRSNLAPKHACKDKAHPHWVKKKKRVPSRFKRFWFYLSWRKQNGQL